MTEKDIYESALDFLMSFETIKKSDLDKHLVSEYEKPNDLKIIYKGLCKSAQEKQMSTNVIGNAIGGIDNLKNVLFDFDPHRVADKFGVTDTGVLLSEIQNILYPTGQMRTTPKSLWPEFCQSVIDSAHFLKYFETAEKFYEWSNIFTNDIRAKPALPLMISNEISGIGFPLACNFLKELGFVEYGKPDVHLKDIFKALQIINPNIKSVTKQDYSTFKAIDRIANSCNVTSYAVDKVFWLIGSGNFYLTGKNIGSLKINFINKMRKKYTK
ncbi:MAG: hypothetical protein PHN88_01495 [Ignavibacteria bacterium]|nr:hypothetical protein [Ignavibacteria bacterium]